MSKYKDIRLLPQEKKYEIYDKIGLGAKGVETEEHSSGFPAITIDYKDLHLLTDCLSLTEWWLERKKQEQKDRAYERIRRNGKQEK